MGNNQKIGVPPSTNRGALNTSRIGLRALVDWFQGTLKFAQLGIPAHEEIILIMGLDKSEFRELPLGYKQWRKGLRLGSIQVYYDHPTEPSCHLILPGQGCREFETLSKVGWVNFFRQILVRMFSISRLDLAIDDFGRIDPKAPSRGIQPYFSVQTLITKIEQGLCRSKFEWGRTIGKIKLDDGTYHGRSLYFGSPQSRIQIRVYEKNWERINKGFELEEGVEVWNRTEVQMRKKRAFEAVRLIAMGDKPVGDIVSGVICNYVNFVDRDPEDSNKSRWKVSRFWREFLGDVKPLRLSLEAPDRTIARVERWIDRQVEPSLALLWLAHDGELNWLIEMLEEGCERLTDKDLDMLERTKADYQRILEVRRIEKQHKEIEERMRQNRLRVFSTLKPEKNMRTEKELVLDLEGLASYPEDKTLRENAIKRLSDELMKRALTDGAVEGPTCKL